MTSQRILFSMIDDCVTANKAVVIVKGLDDWPGKF